MSQRATAKEIDAVAAAWVVRLDGAPLLPDAAAELEAWLAEDIRHRGAFARARAIFLHSDRARALGSNFDPDEFRRRESSSRGSAPRLALSRRWVIGASGALAASLAIAAGWGAWNRPLAYATERGQTRLVPLEDGSTLTLNTASRLEVDFSEARRDIRLVEGEVLFDVAKSPSRPFVVDVSGVQVTAVGTSFTVRRLSADAIQVIVREGIVDVAPVSPTSHGANVLRLRANQIGIVRAGAGAAIDVDPTTVARELTWREGIISLEDIPLSEAADRFARYSDPRIVIDDPAIGNEKITGLFASDNPAGFAKAAAESLDLKLRISEDRIHLTR